MFYYRAESLSADQKIQFNSSFEEYRKLPVKNSKQSIANTKKTIKSNNTNKFNIRKVIDHFGNKDRPTDTTTNDQKQKISNLPYIDDHISSNGRNINIQKGNEINVLRSNH